jgi:hypothetical protein
MTHGRRSYLQELGSKIAHLPCTHVAGGRQRIDVGPFVHAAPSSTNAAQVPFWQDEPLQVTTSFVDASDPQALPTTASVVSVHVPAVDWSGSVGLQ